MDSGIRALSSLFIDVDKDWKTKKIENLGAPDSRDDVPRWSDVGGAFLIVAAADTPSLLKNRADYVCDGTNTTGGDQDEINAALGAADVVILCPGTYWIDASVSMASGKSLIGGGPGCVLKLKDGADVNVNLIVNSDTTAGNDHIVIKDLKLDGNAANNPTGGQNGIFFRKVAPSSTTLGCRIVGCHVENFKYRGIYILPGENNIISGNIYQGNYIGIRLDTNANHNIVSENICLKNSE